MEVKQVLHISSDSHDAHHLVYGFISKQSEGGVFLN